MMLVTGGVSSGKSEFAEKKAAAFGRRVVYLATAVATPSKDAELRRKIAVHQARRPKHWRTVVLNGTLPEDGLRIPADAILLDSLSLWISARLTRPLTGLKAEIGSVIRRLRLLAPVIVVSDEAGLGMVPLTKSGRRFLDALGRINADVARAADEVFLVVAGQPLQIKKPGHARPR
ncbi:bifunctional adenosylcobinamide kinase/adenosylcobinamide-phosphate guanylyltransferase [bacterium]|nr:bifunctional adenosylcobinamide kinase/adenosylcobinamide-phosphate guanylyltransferase [bacterium]